MFGVLGVAKSNVIQCLVHIETAQLHAAALLVLGPLPGGRHSPSEIDDGGPYIGLAQAGNGSILPSI